MNRNKAYLGFAIFTTISIFYSCGRVATNSESNYKTIKIGNQVWMAENLSVDHFRNGDAIPDIKSNEEWKVAGNKERAACCCYENAALNCEKFGKLYNWYTINDPRGLAPLGWHIPNNRDWIELEDYLGKSDAGFKMKSIDGWVDNDGNPGNGTNLCNFTGLPGGCRLSDGTYRFINNGGFWWSSTQGSNKNSWGRYLWHGSNNIIETNPESFKEEGLSVRCIKDLQ